MIKTVVMGDNVIKCCQKRLEDPMLDDRTRDDHH